LNDVAQLLKLFGSLSHFIRSIIAMILKDIIKFKSHSKGRTINIIYKI